MASSSTPSIVLRGSDEQSARRAQSSEGDGSMVNGYQATYSCMRGSPDVKSVDILFDYEFVLPDPREGIAEVLQQDVPLLEWALVVKVAEATSVRMCQLEEQNLQQWVDDEALQGKGEEEEENTAGNVLSLSSLPRDQVDRTVESCQFLDASSATICVPMQGIMRAEYTGNHEEAVKKYILFHIGHEMDAQNVLVDPIKQILFLGNRTQFGNDISPPPSPPNNPADVSSKGTNDDSSNKSFVALAAGLSAAAVFVLLAIVFWIARHRRRTAAVVDEAETPVEEGPPPIEKTESPSFDNNTDLECPSDGPSERGVSVDDYIDGGDDGEDEPIADEQVPDAASNISIPDEQTSTAAAKKSSTFLPNIIDLDDPIPDEPIFMEPTMNDDDNDDIPIRPDERASTASPMRKTDAPDEPATSPMRMVDVLPPLPPVGPSSKTTQAAAARSGSKTMKRKRRKKKKKKKKKTLVRTSSRESIDEMETITEAAEEEEGSSEEEGDEGSEYSWSTEEDDRSGSRHSSPCRSLGSGSLGGGAGSREPSPCRSLDRSTGSWNSLNDSTSSDRKLSSLSAPCLDLTNATGATNNNLNLSNDCSTSSSASTVTRQNNNSNNYHHTTSSDNLLNNDYYAAGADYYAASTDHHAASSVKDAIKALEESSNDTTTTSSNKKH